MRNLLTRQSTATAAALTAVASIVAPSVAHAADEQPVATLTLPLLDDGVTITITKAQPQQSTTATITPAQQAPALPAKSTTTDALAQPPNTTESAVTDGQTTPITITTAEQPPPSSDPQQPPADAAEPQAPVAPQDAAEPVPAPAPAPAPGTNAEQAPAEQAPAAQDRSGQGATQEDTEPRSLNQDGANQAQGPAATQTDPGQNTNQADTPQPAPAPAPQQQEEPASSEQKTDGPTEQNQNRGNLNPEAPNTDAAAPQGVAPGEVPPGSPAPAPQAPPQQSKDGAATRASGAAYDIGVFGHDTTRIVGFEEEMGRKVDRVSVFPTRGSWDSVLKDTWWLDKAPADFKGTLDVGVRLWQEDGNLQTAAAGGYNAQWEQLGRMVQERYPGSSIRIGWEQNLGSWNDHATPENVEEWKAAFREASKSVKKGGPSLKVVWNPNKGKGDSLPDASQSWPGDDVVDVVGLDAYDWWPGYTPETWPEHRDGDQGWRYWVDFARAHGKKFSVPEWGVAPGNDHGGGDNPYFIKATMDFLAEEEAKDGIVDSVVYFDETEGYMANSIAAGQAPKAGDELKAEIDDISGDKATAAAPNDTAPQAQDPAAAQPANDTDTTPAKDATQNTGQEEGQPDSQANDGESEQPARPGPVPAPAPAPAPADGQNKPSGQVPTPPPNEVPLPVPQDQSSARDVPSGEVPVPFPVPAPIPAPAPGANTTPENKSDSSAATEGQGIEERVSAEAAPQDQGPAWGPAEEGHGPVPV